MLLAHPWGGIKNCCMSFILVSLTHFYCFFLVVFLLYSSGTVGSLELHPHCPAGLAKHQPRLVFALCNRVVPLQTDPWALNSHFSQLHSPKPAGEMAHNAQPHKGSDAQVIPRWPGRTVNNIRFWGTRAAPQWQNYGARE